MSLRTDIDRAGGLATKAGLAKRWGLSRARLGQMAAMPSFPAPIAVEGHEGDVYLVAEADKWRQEQKP